MYDKLYRDYFMRVYSYTMTLCGSSQLAEEITQETFLRAMSAGDGAKFQNASSELTWLCAIAKNLFTDEMRKKKRSAELPDDTVSGDSVEEAAVDADSTYRIHVILHSLEAPYKEVFQLRVFGELTFAEIAGIFGKTESWARVTYHRAAIKIRERLNG